MHIERNTPANLRNIVREVDTLRILDSRYYKIPIPLQDPFFAVEIKWNDDTNTIADFNDPNMRQMTQDALSSAKIVCIDYGEPLPESVSNILCTNQSMNRIYLKKCHLSTVRKLFTDRRFNFIKIDSFVFSHINAVPIKTEELEIEGMSLEEVLKINSIEARSLLCNYSNEELQDSLLTMSPGNGFLSLEVLKLDITNNHRFLTPERILGFLEFLNEKMVNLKTVVFKYEEDCFTINYNSTQRRFNILPSGFSNIVSYENNFVNYDGRINVTFDYRVNFGINCDSQETVARYIAELRNELRNFQYSTEFRNICSYNFRNSNIISEKFELKICIQISN